MALDRSKLELVLARAAELDAGAGDSPRTFSEEDVSRVAAELGISALAVTRALSEANAGQSLNVEASAALRGDPAQVIAGVSTYLHMRGLGEVGAGVWEQRTGWWPDVYRFRVVTPVAVAATFSSDQTHITLTAGLDRIWRLHLISGLLGLLALIALGLPPLSVTSFMVATVQAGVVVGVAWWSYRFRRRAILMRLQWALEEIGRPSYQLQPW